MLRLAAALALLPTLAAAAVPEIHVNCADWQRTGDGTWKAGPKATLTYPQSPGSFAGHTVAPGQVRLGTIDLAGYLDTQCGGARQAP
jgi:hypothetical protein